jgi:hypothetical protein
MEQSRGIVWSSVLESGCGPALIAILVQQDSTLVPIRYILKSVSSSKGTALYCTSLDKHKNDKTDDGTLNLIA